MPSTSAIFGITFCKCRSYRFAVCTSVAKTAQFCSRASEFVGWYVVPRHYFKESQQFSIGLRSGDFRGVFHQYNLRGLNRRLIYLHV